MIGETTRRRFLSTLGLGTAGGLAVSTIKASVAKAQPLDKHFERSCGDPYLKVSFPSDWHFLERMTPDLSFPIELFNIASVPLGEHPSPAQSGDPDMSYLPDDSVLLRVMGYWTRDAERHYLQPASTKGPNRLSLDTFTIDESNPKFRRFSLWTTGPDFGYIYQVWLGRRASTTIRETARAVVKATTLE